MYKFTCLYMPLYMYMCVYIYCGSAGKESACNGKTWVRSLDWEDPLEKGKATYSSIVAWRIPWTIQSMRSQRVKHG